MQLSQELLARYIFLQEQKGVEVDIETALEIINDLTNTIEKYYNQNENDMLTAIKEISGAIQTTRIELAEKLPSGVVPEATQELDAVVKSTENATNEILDSAEEIRDIIPKITDKSAAKLIEDRIIKIFEACNFQDITGQRIKKVTATLKYIEDSINNVLSSLSGKEKSESSDTQDNPSKPDKPISEMNDQDLMNGPQLDESAPNQDDVDKLFDSA